MDHAIIPFFVEGQGMMGDFLDFKDFFRFLGTVLPLRIDRKGVFVQEASSRPAYGFPF